MRHRPRTVIRPTAANATPPTRYQTVVSVKWPVKKLLHRSAGESDALSPMTNSEVDAKAHAALLDEIKKQL